MVARENRAAFGAKLRELRESRGIGLKRLAREVGVGQSYLSRVERGVVPASERLIRRVAGVLGAEPEALLLASGRLPSDICCYLVADPARVIAVLREEFSCYNPSPRHPPAVRSVSEPEEERPCRQDGR